MSVSRSTWAARASLYSTRPTTRATRCCQPADSSRKVSRWAIRRRRSAASRAGAGAGRVRASYSGGRARSSFIAGDPDLFGDRLHAVPGGRHRVPGGGVRRVGQGGRGRLPGLGGGGVQRGQGGRDRGRRRVDGRESSAISSACGLACAGSGSLSNGLELRVEQPPGDLDRVGRVVTPSTGPSPGRARRRARSRSSNESARRTSHPGVNESSAWNWPHSRARLAPAVPRPMIGRSSLDPLDLSDLGDRGRAGVVEPRPAVGPAEVLFEQGPGRPCRR